MKSLDHTKYDEVPKVTKKGHFGTFGSKSLKSDNLTFSQIWRFIEKREGVLISGGGTQS